MRVLVACEESQAVTCQLRALGHEAFSCDILEPSGGHPEWHIQRDVGEVIAAGAAGAAGADGDGRGWDMMIAFPPCTHLACSGARHFKAKREDGRQQDAIQFFMDLATAPIHKIAVENPVGIMSTHFRKPDQIVQPYQFGDPAQKTTCLWLKNLPALVPTDTVDKGEFVEFTSKKGVVKRQPAWYYHSLRSKNERSVLRSKTFPGIAAAMANQWGVEE